MSHTLFISDLHLCGERPRITQSFLRFLAGPARQAEALYILGDLFEYWAGDDDLAQDAHHSEVVTSMRALSEAGVAAHVMRGNRDFLLGEGFAQASGATLLPDPLLMDLYGKRVLLSHGDALCTDDLEYQQFRGMVRNPLWQQQFLALPLAQRRAQIEAVRMRSEQGKTEKSLAIMDINDHACASLIRAQHFPDALIHGHTHRPGVHALTIDGHACERIVLGDWYEQGSCLLGDSTGFKPLAVPI